MGKASITIAVGSVFNGAGIEKAIESAGKLGSRLSWMEKRTAASANSMSRDVTRLGMEWESTGRKMRETGRRMASLGDNLTRSVTLPLVGAGAYAGKMAVDFDTALAGVRKTSDLTEAQLESLAQSALELSQTQPVTAETILNIEELGAQLGIAGEDLERFAVVTSGLDIATNMNAEKAGTEMARFANIVGMADDEFSNYGSTLVAIGNNMATTESEVSQMAQRFASAGVQAGLSEAEILGLSAAMSSLGIRAEMGGSALSQVFVSISKSVASGGAQLEAFARVAGMSADEFAAAWRDNAADAFTSLLKGINEASEAGTDMNVVLGELGITQIRQSDIMRRMSGSIGEVTDALDLSRTAWQENTALQAEVDQRNESMASRLQVLKNKVDAVAITVGRPLVEAVISALDALKPAIDAVARAAQAFADMDEEGQRNILMWGGIAAAAGPVLSVTGRLGQGMGGLVGIVGDATSKVGVYTDAMNTLDGANIRTYASANSSASALGLARNAAVQAAGGADRYVKAWDAMHVAAGKVAKAERAKNELIAQAAIETGKSKVKILERASALEFEQFAAEESYKANAKLVTAFGGSTAEAAKAADGIAALSGAFAEVRDGAKDSDKVLSRYNASLRQTQQPARSLGATLKDAVAGGARLAVDSLKQMAVSMAAGGALTAGLTLVAACAGEAFRAFQDMQLHARQAEVASRDFSETLALAGAKAAESTSGVGDMARSVMDLKDSCRGALSATAELGQGIVDSLAEVMARGSALDGYVDTIERLGLNSKLSASEQAQLKAAVDGYNEAAGTQYRVVDAANGVIEDQNGKVLENSGALRENTEEWKRNAEAQAMQNQLVEAYENRYEQTQKLGEAQKAYNEQVENYMNTVPGATRATAEAVIANTTWGTALDDAKLALEGTNEQIAGLEAQTALAASTLSGPFRDAIMEMPTYAQTAGIDMANALAAAVEEGRISAIDAANFLANDVAAALDSLPPEARQDGIDTAMGLAQQLAAGEISVSDASKRLKDAVKKPIDTLPSEAGAVGSSASSGLASGLAANTGGVGSAARGLSSSANAGVAGLPRSLNSTGYEASTGFAGGLGDGVVGVRSSAKKLSGAAKGMNDVGDMKTAGSHLASNFASGLASGINAVASAAGRLAAAAKKKLGFSVPEEGPWSGAERGGETSGRHLAENWARGMRSGMPAIRAAAGELALAAGTPVPLESHPRAAAPLSATSAGDSYTLVINGAQAGSMSPAVRDALRVVFSEYNETIRMGVAR